MAIKFDNKWEPLPWQQEVFDSQAMYKVIRVGRRAGKTEFGCRWISYYTMETGKDSLVIAPTNGNIADIHMDKYFNPLLRDLIDNDLCEASISIGRVKYKFHESLGGGSILLRGAEKIDKKISGLGKNLGRIWIDEFAKVSDQKYLFEGILGPLMLEHDIEFLITSTPKGIDYFWELCERGRNPDNLRYYEFHGSSRINPIITEKNIERLVEEHEWGPVEICENIEADFSDELTSVFGDYRSCAEDYKYPDYKIFYYENNVERGHTYIISADLAKVNDFTVIYILDLTVRPARIVKKVRFQKLPYDEVELIIRKLSKDYNGAKVLTDYTNEKGLTDRLRKGSRMLVEGVVFSGKSKPEMIKNLQWMISKQLFVFSKHDKDLIGEFAVYKATPTIHGNVTYSAPSGCHDDCISSLMLLMWGARAKLRSGQKIGIPSFGGRNKDPYSPAKLGEVAAFYKGKPKIR